MTRIANGPIMADCRLVQHVHPATPVAPMVAEATVYLRLEHGTPVPEGWLMTCETLPVRMTADQMDDLARELSASAEALRLALATHAVERLSAMVPVAPSVEAPAGDSL